MIVILHKAGELDDNIFRLMNRVQLVDDLDTDASKLAKHFRFKKTLCISALRQIL
jgi:hypothetical protein